MSEGNPTRHVSGECLTVTEAPSFVLIGSRGGTPTVYRLEDHTEEGVVLLGFYPREELDAARYLAWFDFVTSIDVLVVTNQAEVATTSDAAPQLGVPVLGDVEERVALDYGATYAPSAGGVVYLIDSNNHIQHQWTGEIDATEIYHETCNHLTDHTAVAQGD